MADNIVLSGNISSIRFRNYSQNKTGYQLSGIKLIGGELPRGVDEDDLLKILYISPLADATPGMEMNLTGSLRKSGRYYNFNCVDAVEKLPVAPEHVRAYIASGGIPFLGKSAAELLVDRLGPNALYELEFNNEVVCDALEDKYSRGSIRAALREWLVNRQNEMDNPVFDALDMSTSERSLVCNRLKGRTNDTLTNKPYSIAYIEEINFNKVDRQIQTNTRFFAGKPGTDKFERYTAALIHTLNVAEKNGDTAITTQRLVDKAAALVELEDPRIMVMEGLRPLIKGGLLQQVKIDDVGCIQKVTWAKKEREIAERLQILIDSKPKVCTVGAKVIDNTERGLDGGQSFAVKVALNNHVCCITGGPGTGKTTTVKTLFASILDVYEKAEMPKPRIIAIAPSGLAAQRLKESTGIKATTCHEALSLTPGEELLGKKRGHIAADIILLDEATMNDTDLMLGLLRAAPPHCRLIMLGDIDQLPSIGAGNVFSDMLSSNSVPQAMLTKSFRYPEGSFIDRIAQSVKNGIVPEIHTEGPDWKFIPQPSAKDTSIHVAKRFAELVNTGVDPYKIQIIAPMHKNFNGTISLNSLIQAEMNKIKERGSVRVGSYRVQEGDRVMNLEKDNAKGLSNGQGGVCTHASSNYISVDYDGKEVTYYPGNFHKITPSWAKSTHKMQGSEEDYVICPVSLDHKDFYSWQLLFTSISRTKKHLTVVGDADVFAHSVNNGRDVKRLTGLKQTLVDHVSSIPKHIRLNGNSMATRDFSIPGTSAGSPQRGRDR